MFAIFKIVLTLSLIVFLLNRKVKMGNAMLAGSGLLFLISNPTVENLVSALTETATSYGTWELLFALYFVMCLEYQLRTGGIVDGLMAASRRLLRSERILLPLMPAFLGCLPSLGGAIFSAPLVESASKPYNLNGETKTAINYWFRHIWEYSNPIFSGMLLAGQLSGIPLSVLISNMFWLTVLAVIIGWLYFISPLKGKDNSAEIPAATMTEQDAGYKYILLAAGPIIANFFLVVFLKSPASIAMGLVVLAMIFILRQSVSDIKAMLLYSFDRNLLWGIAGILFFQSILQQSGTIKEVGLLLNSMAVPNEIIVGVIALVSGLLVGTSQGFVAITFPFIMVLAPGDVTLAMICFVLGTAGQMLSPAHLCLLVTLDYFKADFLKTLRPIAVLEIVMVAVVCIVVKLS